MKKVLVVLLMLVILSSGCVWRVAIDEGEVGLLMTDGVKVSEVLSPGRHGPYWGWYAKVEQVNVSAQTVPWEDPDLITKDKQPIGVTLGVTYARKSECIIDMRQQYRLETVDDAALQVQVLNRIPRNAKSGTAGFTLDEMIAARNIVTSAIFENLESSLDDICVALLDVGVNNIAPSQSYLALLQRKADAQVAVEVAREETKLAEEELLREVKQTDIDLELARRDNLVNEELAKTYAVSPEYYELERLRLLADVVGDTDKIYFVPEGADLTLLLGGQSNFVPVPGN